MSKPANLDSNPPEETEDKEIEKDSPLKTIAEFRNLVASTNENIADEAACLEELKTLKNRQFIVFDLLSDFVLGRRTKTSKFTKEYRTDLESILGIKSDDAERPESIATIDGWKDWLNKNIPDREDLTNWIDQGGFLVVIYELLRINGKEQLFINALNYFSEAIHKLEPVEGTGLVGKIPEALKKATPKKNSLTPSFKDFLGQIVQQNKLTSQLQDDIEQLEKSLYHKKDEYDAAKTEQQQLKAQLKDALSDNAKLTTEVAALRLEIENCEKLIKGTRGAGDDAVRNAMEEQFDNLKREIQPRLENLILYTNRNEPRKDKIIKLANEVSQLFDKY